MGDAFQPMASSFHHMRVEDYNWNYLDQHVCGHSDFEELGEVSSLSLLSLSLSLSPASLTISLSNYPSLFLSPSFLSLAPPSLCILLSFSLHSTFFLHLTYFLYPLTQSQKYFRCRYLLLPLDSPKFGGSELVASRQAQQLVANFVKFIDFLNHIKRTAPPPTQKGIPLASLVRKTLPYF